ncbi:MAG: hypothetical protein ACYTFE_01665 [Planctomycetota bacterium]|jgi:hypothetical protein
MVEQKLKLDGLRADIRGAVNDFSEKLIKELGGNLKSITVVGSSLTEDFIKGKSDINTVLVLGKRDMATLEVIARMGKEMSKKSLSAPLLMTQEYIDSSLDVFGVEFYNFQLLHETVYGEDPFAELVIEKRDVRAQCERELKSTLIRLRQGYISAAGNCKLVRDVLASAAYSLVPLLRALLWLKNLEVPKRSDYVLSEVCRSFMIDIDSEIEKARGWRYEKPKLTTEELSVVFEEFYEAVEKLARIVDELEVK